MKIETNSIIKDAFELPGKEIPFTVRLTQSAKEVYKLRKEVAEIGSQGEDADVELLGELIVRLYTAIFGEEVTQELLNYYADDSYALMIDTLPVITDVVFPAYDRLRVGALEQKKRTKRG